VIAQRVLSNVRPGSIVVMHLKPQTAAALPAILRGLKARGYEAVSLPELFRAAGHH
jgi:peptidoglycan/xylan/chitin deacetylase (PgdA/CDA1 family)